MSNPQPTPAQPSPPAVIFVEDNERLREEMVNYLGDEGFLTRGVDSGEALNRALQDHPADILILDLNMSGEDGISITRRIRQTLPAVGIIILSGRMRSNERLEGYASGADVYLTKPTRPEVLVAVIRNLFVRISRVVQGSQWTLDVAALVLSSPEGAAITLTPSEARLLKELALAGRYLDQEALASRLAKTTGGDGANIEVLISRLRSKLRPHIGSAPSIANHRNQGYQLCLLLNLTNLIPEPGGKD